MADPISTPPSSVPKSLVRIALAGGGSGGHVYPLLAVAEEVKAFAAERSFALDLRYFGPDDEYATVLAEKDIRIVGTPAPKMRRYFALRNFLDIPLFFVALVKAWWSLFWFMPDAVFSKGGPGAIAVVVAAWFYRIPIMIHESDAMPGLTNLVSSRFASRIVISFEAAAKYFNPAITRLTGNPVRHELLEGRLPPETAKKELGFVDTEPLVLVLNGSQGSQRINEFLEINLPTLVKEVQILHQTGKANFLETKRLTQAALIDSDSINEERRYKPVPYLGKDLPTALSAADVVVGRSGSGMIFELASFGKPAILIPLAESANNHQRTNAYEFAKTGAAVVIEESNLLPGIFISQLKTILTDQATLQKMNAAASAFSRPKAAKEIAEEVFRMIG
ncbi:MAG: UDP-N-acetylglucosamine--N-acetylmuramyl-(pentapeptide) pyrophosphoryl-undecaprenol N-acetylglucosamine transferase [Patescibacteria group bacterium]